LAKSLEILCEYQGYIDQPPQSPAQLYGQACSNDGPTVHAWRDTWLKNTRANKAKFGSFREHGVGKLHGTLRNKPAILVGSGPSLKENAAVLLQNKGIPVFSCLHNFHYLEDLGVKVDYYVSLDAGRVVLEEVSEGGKGTADDYWKKTKGKTLLAYVGTDPELLEKWQGEIYFYSCPIPDRGLMDEMNAIENFQTMVSSGGNVLGACMYLAKGIFGCNPLIFMGANFAFSYQHKFHGWDSKYDANIGHCVSMTDVYGNRVKSWQSYANFKAWFDHISMTVPGIYINATEGGTFGAYPGGNIRSVIQMDLKDALAMFNVCDHTEEQCLDPETKQVKILF